jgi:hypothetical protein
LQSVKEDGADYGLKMIFRQEEDEVRKVLRTAGGKDDAPAEGSKPAAVSAPK